MLKKQLPVKEAELIIYILLKKIPDTLIIIVSDLLYLSFIQGIIFAKNQ